MLISFLARWTVVGVLLTSTSSVRAAPPKLDYFFPAGAQRGTTVEIIASGTLERWPVQAYVDGVGVEVKATKASGKLAVTIAKDAPPGVCWIRLHDDDGASIARPFFVGSLPEVMEQEPNDDPKKPHQLADANVTVNGRLDKLGDVDTFAVKLTKGQTLVASLEAYRTLRSPMDGVLQIVSADGFVLEQNDDYHDRDPQIAFLAPKDGTYLVRLFAFPVVPDSSIRFAGKDSFVYRLTLTTGPYVEYTYPLAVSQATPGDVELVGWNIPDELRRQPIALPKEPGTQRLFDPRIANPFEVRVVKQLCLTKKDNPQTITLPVTISGKLARPGDRDIYEMQAKKGQKLSFRIAARTLGFPLDPVLRLSDGAGTTLTQTKAAKIGADPILDYTATQDGVHRLEVSDLHREGGLRYVYRLDAGTMPDFELKVASDRFRIAADKPLEIPVTVTRSAGFKATVTLSLEGAPKEITVTTTATGLTFRAQSKTTFAGPIRIIGTAPDGTRREAGAPVVELTRTTQSLWLSGSR